MIGDIVQADGIVYVVVWDGSRGSFSLSGAFPVPSVMAEIIRQAPAKSRRDRDDA